MGEPGGIDAIEVRRPYSVVRFAWPLLPLYVALEVPFWINVESFQPDFIAWVTAVAAVVALKGLVELASSGGTRDQRRRVEAVRISCSAASRSVQ
jgi:hypothetical protein